jgi:ATP-dependent RNA helicase RhlE
MHTASKGRGPKDRRPSGRRTFSSATRSDSRPNGTRQFSGSRNGKPFGNNQTGGRRFRDGRPSYAQGGNRRPNNRKLASFDPSQFINANPVDVHEEVYTPKHTFSELGLDNRIVRAIASFGYNTPTPIQDQIIPHILQGRDVVGLAETGTGKTAAFLAPLITTTVANPKQTTLILAPTRELALQIDAELKNLAPNMRMYSTVCVGGTSIGPQIRGLKKRNQFVIGTPGRVLDLIRQKHFLPQYVTNVVLDEADRMLDMGFIHDMRTILALVPEEREMLLFSATMSSDMSRIVSDFLRDPIQVSVKKREATNSIAQDVVRFSHTSKFETLVSLLQEPEFKRVIIFGAMKHSVERLANQLTQSGIRADSIHGNKSHAQRQRSLTRFKKGEVQVLVATDVAARGIHVDNVSHVINYDLPNSRDDYVHRIGRTGRGDKRGKALTFIPAR